MNIFDQYGIKEVADVTLYAIELDKNDDEIYIPVLYLDTLKVSTLEQTADSTSARGGQGNSELITWDFGKQITVSLEDALYSPASQSLMWGGKFGIKKTKVYGVWNPFIYESDANGRQKYIERIDFKGEDFCSIPGGWKFYHLVIPGLYYYTEINQFPYVTVEPSQLTTFTITAVSEKSIIVNDTVVDGWEVTTQGDDNETYVFEGYYNLYNDTHQLVLRSDFYNATFPLTLDEEFDTDNLYYYVCPCDGGIKWVRIVDGNGHYKYWREATEGQWGQDHWTEDQLVLTEYLCPKDKPIQESEEVQTVVGKYTIEENFVDSIKWNLDKYPERAVLSMDHFGEFDYKAYEFVSDSENPEICYYQEIEMCDTDSNTVKCTAEHIDAYGYTWKASDVKMLSYEGLQDTYYLRDIDLRYRIRTDNGLREISVEYTNDNENGYMSKIDVYKTIKFMTYVNGAESYASKRVLIGTFYIIYDWNLTGTPPQEFIYEIESGIDNVDYLERTEKCIAKQTFAIDADKNLRCNNYWYMKEYKNTALTVYLDPNTMKPFEPNSDSYIKKDGVLVEGNLTIIKKDQIYYKRTRTKASDYASLGHSITIDAKHFSGVFKLVGETYARAYKDGKDQRYQFEIPLCKLSSDTNLTLQAEGEPTTFSMNLRVLRKDDGQMMKLTQYLVEENIAGGTDVIETDRLPENKMLFKNDGSVLRTGIRPVGEPYLSPTDSSLSLMNPSQNTTYYVDSDDDEPYEGANPYLQKANLSELDIITVTDSTGNSIDTVSSDQLDKSMLLVQQTTHSDKLQDREEYYIATGQPTGREIPPEKIATVVEKKFLSDNEYTVNITPVGEEAS